MNKANVVSLHDAKAVYQMEDAQVQSVQGITLIVQTDKGVETARKAVSCLVQPQPGDLVMVSRSSIGGLYVLAILDRDESDQQETLLAFEGPVRISSASSFSLSSDRAHFMNRELKVSNERLSLFSNTLNAQTDTADLKSRSISIASQWINIVAECYHRHLKSLVSLVQGEEIRKSKQLIETVQDTHMTRSGKTLIDARKDLKMNAERIHMG